MPWPHNGPWDTSWQGELVGERPQLFHDHGHAVFQDSCVVGLVVFVPLRKLFHSRVAICRKPAGRNSGLSMPPQPKPRKAQVVAWSLLRNLHCLG